MPGRRKTHGWRGELNPRVIWEALLSNRGGARPKDPITLRKRLDAGYMPGALRNVKVVPSALSHTAPFMP